jgi:CBS domain-containing protein
MCIAYGTNVPSGLFLPGMIIGCSTGQLYGRLLGKYDLVTQDESYQNAMKSLVVIGCGALLSGYTRMTYSVAVILLETSNSLNLFVPLTLTILIANQTGSLFTRGLYERACRAKQLPIIIESVPFACKHIVAENIMTKDVVTLSPVEDMSTIRKVLTQTKHHMFPIVNKAGHIIGSIPRNYIITLI